MKHYKIESQQHWHDLRASHIGGSEVAALFDASPYLTRFELWVNKSGKANAAFPDSERMFWGRMLEKAIGEGVAAITGMPVEKADVYLVNERVRGMGCTPDFFITHPVKGAGILQTKNVDRLEFLGWDDQPPLTYLLQVQHEIACAGVAWGMLAVLVGGNELKTFEYDAHPAAIAKIEKAITDFWQSVDDGIEPKAVADDYDIVRDLYQAGDSEVDMTADNELPELCATALEAARRRIDAEKQEKQAKASIMQKVKDAGRALCSGFEIKQTTISKAEHTVKPTTYKKLTIKEITA